MNVKAFLLLGIILTVGLFSTSNVNAQMIPIQQKCFSQSSVTVCLTGISKVDNTHWILTGTLQQNLGFDVRLNSITVIVYDGSGMSGQILATGVLNNLPLTLPSGVTVQGSGTATSRFTGDQAFQLGYLNADHVVTVHAQADACRISVVHFWHWTWNSCVGLPYPFNQYESFTETFTVGQLEAMTQ